MSYFQELKKRAEQEKRSETLVRTPLTPVVEQPEQQFSIDSGATLKKDDLKKFQYLNPIRDYMIERKGADYIDAPDEEVVDDFVQHMRYFNANSVSTAGEVRFIGKANDARKEKARRAYEIYDALGNVFQNDGMVGAVDGVKDYVFAAAKDPTNYVGLVTGGAFKFFAGGTSLVGKQSVRAAVRAAGREALKSGATKQAAQEAAKKAGKEAASRAVARGATKKQADKLFAQVSEKAGKEGQRALAVDAMRKKQSDLFKTASKKSLKATILADSSFAVLQDLMAQRTYLKVGAQEEYSKARLGFSGLLGGVAGAAQLGFGKFRGASGFDDTGDPVERVANNIIDEYTPILDEAETKEAVASIKKEVKDWNTKVESGREMTEATMPADLIKNIMLGEDGTGGLAKIFKDKGLTLSRKKTVSDVITNVARFIPEEDLADINKELIKYTGIQIGELAESGVQLGNLLAKDISTAGSILNVQSQVRKVLDGSIVTASDRLAQTIDSIDSKQAVAKELKRANKAEPLKYGQSVWKRLLVSSPATTAVNVAGFAQYYVGQTMADILNSTYLMTKGLGQQAINPAAAKESFRQATVLRQMQAQKMRNFLDPYTTHDAYLDFLDKNESARKILFETMAGGVEATADRYNINPNNKLFKGLEAYATAAGQLTGVRIQDTFTKSQMFMNELDKYLRLDKGVTLKEALLQEDLIDETSLQGALDGTLKSVFAKDYTTKEQPELLRTTAKLVEGFSNTPVLGSILPFGRFFNNVVATTYQWSFFALPETMYKFIGSQFSKNPDITANEALARALVGTTAMRLAMEYDQERREKGLGIYDVEVGGGTIIDAKNTFPFSIFLAAGRVGNMMRNGEDVPPETRQEILTQIGVGQFARDIEFGNDLNNVLDIFFNQDDAERAANIDAFYKVGGNFASGFTRPLDAFNKLFGLATGTDTAKDVRQASGMGVFTQSATKYVDNVLEALIDAADTITDEKLGIGELGKESLTGEELRVATREGEVYDANPFARMFGLTIKPGRTATEKAYSMAEMFPWQANERTKIPAYDKALNALVAPVLEQHTNYLIRSTAFQEASLTGKRKMLKNMVSDVKTYMRKTMSEGYAGGENQLLRMAASASKKGTKEIRKEAMDIMREKYGVTATLEDMTYRELTMFMEYVDYLEEVYKEASDI